MVLMLKQTLDLYHMDKTKKVRHLRNHILKPLFDTFLEWLKRFLTRKALD